MYIYWMCHKANFSDIYLLIQLNRGTVFTASIYHWMEYKNLKSFYINIFSSPFLRICKFYYKNLAPVTTNLLHKIMQLEFINKTCHKCFLKIYKYSHCLFLIVKDWMHYNQWVCYPSKTRKLCGDVTSLKIIFSVGFLTPLKNNKWGILYTNISECIFLIWIESWDENLYS